MRRRRSTPRIRIWSAAIGVTLAGCYTGLPDREDGDGPGAEGDEGAADDGSADRLPGECAAPEVPTSPLRRLTRSQYDHTARDLLGSTRNLAAGFVEDEKMGAFYSNATTVVPELAVEQYMDAAEILAADAVMNLAALLPCDPDASDEDSCAQAFVEEFGRRAYRRPLDGDEVDRAMALFAAGRMDASFADGIRLVVSGMLQSPRFLYHVEVGMAPDGDEEVVPLSAHELANRLSYFLWDTMPDPTLAAAADSGALAQPGELDAQVRRMVAHPRASTGIASFHAQWLGLEGLPAVEKDATVYPLWDDQLASSMAAETAAFTDWVIRGDDGRLATMLTSSVGFVDAPLAALYGVSLPVDADPTALTEVDLDPSQRSGVLTHAGVLAAHSHTNQTSPVLRGKLMRENFFCQPLPPPPDDVDDTPPGLDPNLPTKERYEQHRTDPACAGCHVLMDPVGIGLEHYDGIGAFRTMDGNVPVDAVGEIISTDIDGEFDGALELAEKMADSEVVRSCVMRQWLRFGLGRFEQAEDACTVDNLKASFEASDGDLFELIVAIAKSDSMRFRRIAGGESAGEED